MLRSLTAIILVLAFLLIPTNALAFNFFKSSACGDKNDPRQSSALCNQASSHSGDTAQSNQIVDIIQVSSGIVALLAGLLAVVMIIISGFTLITSAGNQEAVTNSRKRITSSIIGLVIVALAWAIVRVVTDRIIQ